MATFNAHVGKRAWDDAVGQLDAPPKVCLVFPDGFKQPASRVMRHFQDFMPEDCQMFGAQVSTDTTRLRAPTQFHESGPVQDAIVVLVLAGPVTVHSLTNQSW
ncbi:MAG: hypothetical protein F6K39_46555, partial [Okeania sp. SIO3B3]|nr:hypothetical protein [Okeania sp. SIO3B3]